MDNDKLIVKPKPTPSPDILRQLLRYDPDTGKLFWMERPEAMFQSNAYSARRNCAAWNAQYAGQPALAGVDPYGYRRGAIFNRSFFAHRVAWAIYKGQWPSEQIDHINGNRSDNRLVNLREATAAQNNQNSKSRSGSTSPYLGVSWDKDCRKWRAVIYGGKTRKHLGLFEKDADAARAYDVAATLLRGEFARLNFKEVIHGK